MDLLYALFALATAVLPIGLFWALLAWNERKQQPRPNAPTTTHRAPARRAS